MVSVSLCLVGVTEWELPDDSHESLRISEAGRGARIRGRLGCDMSTALCCIVVVALSASFQPALAVMKLNLP